MSVRSIEEVKYDEAASAETVAETVQGQPQSAPREPDTGEVAVNESRLKVDQAILDPNHELAVQVPEGVGARADEDALLSEVYSAGTAEEQFAAADKASKKPAAKSS